MQCGTLTCAWAHQVTPAALTLARGRAHDRWQLCPCWEGGVCDGLEALTMFGGRFHIVFGSSGVHSKSHQGVRAPSHLCLSAEAVGLAGVVHTSWMTKRSRHQIMQILWVKQWDWWEGCTARLTEGSICLVMWECGWIGGLGGMVMHSNTLQGFRCRVVWSLDCSWNGGIGGTITHSKIHQRVQAPSHTGPVAEAVVLVDR